MTQVGSTSSSPIPRQRIEIPYARPELSPALGSRSLVDSYLSFHCFVLLMLALAGRGFAYLGPSELSLALSGLVLFFCPVGVRRVFSLFPTVLIIPFLVWGLLQTLPYIKQYGFNALRDAAQWGYVTWGITIGAMVASRPARLGQLLMRFRAFSRIALMVLPVVFVAQHVTEFPRFWGDVPVIQLKSGDTMVHLGAIGAFLWIAPVPPLQMTAQIYAPVFVVLFLIGNRAGQIACMLQLGLAVMARGITGRVFRSLLFVIIPLTLFALSGAKFKVGEKEVSLDRLVAAAASVLGDSGESRFDNTKEWRLNWWGDIIDYTVFGPYFWSGKGFGVNLADDDGYQIAKESALRSPHNSHITVLARMGVPGAVMHLALNFAWAITIVTSMFSARRLGRTTWFRLFAFLGIYWAAWNVNACFDVVLEGPMASAWIWTFFGVGLGAVWIYRHVPEALPDLAPATQGNAFRGAHEPA